MAVDIGKLLDDINAGLTEMAQTGFTFDVAEELPPLASASHVTWNTKDIQPPGSLYLARDDGLRFSVWIDAATPEVELAGRFLRIDGEVIRFSEVRQPLTGYQQEDFDLTLGEGFLLNASLHARGPIIQRGECYAKLTLTQGSGNSLVETTTLIAGYLQQFVRLSWPPGIIEHANSGHGRVRQITVTPSGAGTSASLSPGLSTSWKLRWARAVFVSSAVVANRFLRLSATLPSGATLLYDHNRALVASTTYVYWIGQFGGELTDVGGFRYMTLPEWPPWPAGTVMVIGWTNEQAGDLLTSLTFMFEEWPTV